MVPSLASQAVRSPFRLGGISKCFNNHYHQHYYYCYHHLANYCLLPSAIRHERHWFLSQQSHIVTCTILLSSSYYRRNVTEHRWNYGLGSIQRMLADYFWKEQGCTQTIIVHLCISQRNLPWCAVDLACKFYSPQATTAEISFYCCLSLLHSSYRSVVIVWLCCNNPSGEDWENTVA